MMSPQNGLAAIKEALSVIGEDRLWLKFGHGRFVLLRRKGNRWSAHHTRLEISEEEAKANGYEAEVRSRSRSVTYEETANGLENLLRISRREDGGIFWVPAGGDANLPLKSEITHTRHIGCEIDDCDKEEQLARYEWFSETSGLSYGLQLSSGSKSIHSHLFLEEAAQIDAVVRLRRLFILALLGDPAVARPHQPMRFPGFYRREKGNYQTLLTANSVRYSHSEIESGLQRTFDALNWVYPSTLGEEFWADLQRALKASHSAREKRAEIKALLERGDHSYVERKAEIAKRRRQYAQRKLSGEFNLFTAIQELESKLDPLEAFNAPQHDWRFSGSSHARGHCQWHESTSNSAWLSSKQGQWRYHCPTCTNDKPIGAFQYWLSDQHGLLHSPKGARWAELAKEWLTLHGITIPRTSLSTRDRKKKKGKRSALPTKQQWLAEQKKARDHSAYQQISKLLGLKNPIDVSNEDYKEKAHSAFYEPLKRYLKYETRGDRTSGFVSEQMPNEGQRSLIAYDCSQGTGKSNNAIIPLALRTARLGKRVLIFVPTRGLAKEFKGRINNRAGYDIAATHLDEKYYSAAIVVSCPESAYKFKGQHFEAILVDEANEVFYRIESAELGNAGPQSLASFRQLLSAAATVIIATAAMSGWSLAAAQTIGGFTSEETQLQKRDRPQTKMTVVEYDNYYQWLQQIVSMVSLGLRVSIPTGSRGRGRTIDRLLRKLFPAKCGMVIDGAATLKTQRTRFLSDPDAFLEEHKPDWFIFTPVINSGVSIENQHFDVQFEYATPHEGAQSISQRGERVRSAIGRDGAFCERHIYFSQKGAPTLEAYSEALSWQYWLDELNSEAAAPIGAAAGLARALGAEKALKPIRREAEKFAKMRQNLPHLLALKAFEIIFRRELLREDWKQFGWEVHKIALPNKTEQKQIKKIRQLEEAIKIGLIEQRGRTFKKARTRNSEDSSEEINNPFQAIRIEKHQLEKVLGKTYLANQSEEFYTAWIADKGAHNPGVRSVIRSQLLDIALKDTECWRQIERMKALKLLVGKRNPNNDISCNLPELPATQKDIELTSIISRCPGVKEIITGRLKQWTNQDSCVVSASIYLIAHRKQIAANTKRLGLIKGAIFSEQMTPTALLNKALELMGYKPIKEGREGKGNRLNLYRLETVGEYSSSDKKNPDRYKSAIKLFRERMLIVRSQTRSAMNAAARESFLRKAAVWVTQESETQVKNAIEIIKKRHADQKEKSPSNLGDALKMYPELEFFAQGSAISRMSKCTQSEQLLDPITIKNQAVLGREPCPCD